MNHSFDVELATLYGIEEAIIIENLAFWIKKNIANKKNFIEGEYWTYNSAKAFNELFPYMNSRKISRVLEKLESKKIIKSGNFNKAKYDRTKWYCIIDVETKIRYKIPINADVSSFDNLTNGIDNSSNGFTQNDQPIPDIKPDINTDCNLTDSQKKFREQLLTFKLKLSMMIRERNFKTTPEELLKISGGDFEIIERQFKNFGDKGLRYVIAAIKNNYDDPKYVKQDEKNKNWGRVL